MVSGKQFRLDFKQLALRVASDASRRSLTDVGDHALTLDNDAATRAAHR
ncbi:hypothetical protein PT015_06965 [Candidatus Mycobacterium wuenschmannii]|uniref:Uncharacterized protein n=1 Tax=Candidatus Mycobacterium wuenschmannii TaxID=3027808 RepID=A0ABY8W007_9MYCO|nr:hypothetical protein [Candidatus Mycobacterium wuenschmannii]WIM89188.1 hypothetical protein PT015_06965 [Candidatus Mycobacterium wuenschmannii]